MPPYPGFLFGSYEAQSPIADCEALINMYPETSESPGAKSKMVLYPTPGVEAFTTTPTPHVGGRGMFTNGDGRVFGVTGLRLYEYLTDGSYVERGTVTGDSNPAYFCSNGDGGNQLGICSGGTVYCYDLLTNTLTTELSGAYTHIGMLYGYFVALDSATSRVRQSDLFDGTTWDPTDYFERSIGSDGWIAMLVTTSGYIWLLGPQSGEVWYNAGTFPIPFAPHPSGLDLPGAAAAFSLTQVNSTVTWLSTNKDGGYQVLSAQGFRPSRISNHAEEYLYSQALTLADGIGQTYRSRGHIFFLLTLPTANQTRGYDFTTNMWHQRGTWDAPNNIYVSWRPVYHCFGFGKHLMSDVGSGYVYEMNDDFTSDITGLEIRRVRRAPAINRGNRLISYGKFELYLQSGNGVVSGQGVNPMVLLRVSNDGGRTWGPERRCGSGPLGKYGTRVFWEMNGQARDRAFEVTVTDPVAWAWIDAFLDWAVEPDDTERTQEAA